MRGAVLALLATGLLERAYDEPNYSSEPPAGTAPDNRTRADYDRIAAAEAKRARKARSALLLANTGGTGNG